MPPEQAVDSASIDARADIYSLGCTLYYLLTGTPPFSGPSMMSVLLKHRDAPIPKLSSTHGPVPPGLEAIYEKMMAKSVATRYQSMGEVIQELEQIRLQLGSVPGTNISSQTTGIFHPSSISSIAILRPDQKTIVARPVENSAISVLVVEPSRLQAGFIRKYLEQSAIRVLSSVTTGAAAEQAIRMEKPTAIVSSLYLSDMTGLELAQKIRADYPSAAPGFVLISSESESSEAQQLSQLNRVLLLPKPFGPEQLVSSVHLVTGQSISGRAGLAPPITRRNRAELRVLVVDDSSTARVHERIILNQLGFTQIHEASDGAQAIAAATREAFDLIVTDYNMPLLDGRALVSYLKQTTSTAAVPIVMVTTETEARILDPVRELGVAEIFPKAFPSDQVESLMKKLFG
jgi:two-component system chemotaxis response regulator CheY